MTSKQPKTPFANIRKPTETQLAAATKPVPFKHCPSCGNSIISSAKYCNECARLVELGMRTAVKQFEPSNDTQQAQSYDAFNRSGYSDRIPSSKIPPSRERF
jgi:predicted RNA-binding Zn-ribbon protein involved in translation (DUF1610 family)